MILEQFKKEFSKIDIENSKKVRQFCFVVGALLVIISIFLIENFVGTVLSIIGATLIVLGFTRSTLANPIYKGWMMLAILLGLVVSKLLLSLTYYVILTPIGLVLRLFRKDLLSLKIEKNRGSYWIPRTKINNEEEIKKSYSKMF